ncbi:MAG: outer membrane beta-barrel protein [Bacteroidota bacterium]|nr:outer membrane beta-barrel protein [Bacteroidota bacterium]MDX5430526.1 outer membrane beta-barrel protein [Bacteroidota bacterium]MDX5469279.1 outer membrane beta-barrel protein [Bacteroidota bacterium]
MTKRSLFSFLFFGILFLSGDFSFAQKEDWSFVDRTGIKGIQFSLGNQLLSDPFYHNRILGSYVQETLTDSIKVRKSQDKRLLTSGNLQIVYAPFRFSNNTWYRNFELIGGLHFQANPYRRIELKSGYENTDTSGIYNKKVYELNQFTGLASLTAQVNYPIGGSWMVYGGISGGWGVFRGLNIKTSGNVQTIFVDDSLNNQQLQISYETEPEQVFYQSTGYWMGQLHVGAKVYLTCRFNLYIEYGIQSLHFYPKGKENYHQFSQGLQVGLRLKFNPPDSEDPKDEKKTRGAFW